jgi:hypothetical protein
MTKQQSFEQEIEQIGRDAVPILTRFFVAIWNLLMRGLIAVGIMPVFRKQPWLHAVLIFLVMAAAPYVGVFFLIAGLVAGSHGAKADNDFVVSLNKKAPERFMGAQSDTEEREAYQGEAMLRAHESGATMEEAKKVYEAVGELYDRQKAREGNGREEA